MDKEEFAAWQARTENSRFKWTEDEIYRLNGRGVFYYMGGEDGIYMAAGQDGTFVIGTYEGAIPHIGEASFTKKAEIRCADFSVAFEKAVNAGGKKFLADVFSAGAPDIPSKRPHPPNHIKGRGGYER
jgi:hypothetical protein